MEEVRDSEDHLYFKSKYTYGEPVNTRAVVDFQKSDMKCDVKSDPKPDTFSDTFLNRNQDSYFTGHCRMGSKSTSEP